MKFKGIMLVLMSLVIVMMISAASASTDAGNETLSEGFINDLDASNDTIYLKGDVYIEHDVTIDKSVRIIGTNGTVFEGESKNSLFTISNGARVTFENVRFNNFTKDTNGAVFDIKKSSGLVLINCTFTNNVMAISNYGDLEIYDSYFYNNSLTGENTQGGAISNNRKLYIENTVFTDSTASKNSRGVAIYSGGDLTLNKTTIARAYAGEDSKGSALFNNGNCLMVDSIIENNVIERYNFNYMHGCIYNQGNLTATGSIFRNNTGKYVRPNTWYEGSPTIYNVGDISLTWNAFIGNVHFNGLATDVFSNGARHICLDDNWWECDENPIEANRINEGNAVSSWIVLDITPEYAALAINGSVPVKAAFALNGGGEVQNGLFSKFDIVLFDGERYHSDSFVFNRTQNPGQYEITAKVFGFTKTATVDVGKIPVCIGFRTGNVTYPEDVLVELTSNVDGNLTLTIDSRKYIVKIEGGRGNVTFSNLDAGDYELAVSYEGDENHSRAFNTTTLSVAKMQVALTITNVSDIRTGEVMNARIILGPNVSPVTAQLYINGEFAKPIYLYGAVNNLTFRNMAEGRYVIDMVIAQTENYFASNATAVFNVGRYDPKLNIEVRNVRLGENATLQITSDNFTGYVTLSVNGANSTLFIRNGANITVSNLEGGRYEASVIFNGDSMYRPSSAATSFRVIRADPEFTVSVDINGRIQVRTNPNCTGRVGVYVNFDVHYLNLTNGKADFRVSFEKGTNYIFAFYDGDGNFENATYNTTLMLDSDFIIVSEDIVAYEYNDFAYSIVLVEENRITMPDRVVSIAFNGQIHNVTTDNDGVASLRLNLACGNYRISASYLNRTVTNRIMVNPVTFTLNVDDVEYGQNQIITAEFEGNITGEVSFRINDIIRTAEISGSQATVNISGLKVGKYNVRATYSNAFISKTATSTFNVLKATPKMSVKATNILPGEDETIEVTFEGNVTGEVKITVDKEYIIDISNSKAVLSLKNLEMGEYGVLVKYGGNENYTGCEYETSFAVRNETSVLILDINNTCFGQDVIVRAKLNATAKGNVTFAVSSISKTAQVTNGEAICRFTSLGGGTYRVDARYGGDMTFAPSQAHAFFRVLKADAAINIVTDEIALGENIMIYAYLPSNATGSVYFSMIGYYSPRAKQIEDGIAYWYISPLDAGKYTVVATYAGDANYSPANATFTLKVSQTKSILSVSINDVSVNDRITANIQLTGADGEAITGKVNLRINNKVYSVNVKNGIAKFVIGKLDPGNYMFSSAFDGDEEYSTSSAAGSFIVAENLLESSLCVNNITAYYKGTQRLEIALTSNGKAVSQASVIVKVNGRKYSLTTDNDGKATLKLNLTSGKYVAEIAFEKTLSHEANSEKAYITVLSTINATDVVKLYNTGTQYFAIFYAPDGKALGNTEVTFKLNGKTYKVKTLPNGVVRLNININPGTYKITAINPKTGEKAVNSIRIYAKIMKNRDLTQYYGANKVFKVQIFNATTGKHVGTGQKVKFKIGKRTYTAKTNKNGYASIKITAKPGKYRLITSYGGYKVSNRIVVKSVLTAKNIIGKNVRKVKFKVKLVSKKGKALKGKKITIKFKGKKYRAKTNRKGIASLTLKNLRPGKYKVVSSYGKSKITNTIKIRK